ncbi:MAG: hypothetical protein SCK29_04840 [Bacillota bacterium]|nr:hypothetical protein [Bacillota bacterium]MDW7683431.1 hypothetical protein [Bacillota bacterium]
MLLLLIAILLLIAVAEAPRLAVERMWKELAAFLTLWALGSFMAIAQVTGLELPNPTDLINAIFAPK